MMEKIHPVLKSERGKIWSCKPRIDSGIRFKTRIYIHDECKYEKCLQENE